MAFSQQLIRDQNRKTLEVREFTEPGVTARVVSTMDRDPKLIHIDNTPEADDIAYLKAWNDAAPTLGATPDACELILPCDFNAYPDGVVNAIWDLALKSVFTEAFAFILTKTQAHDTTQVALDNAGLVIIGTSDESEPQLATLTAPSTTKTRAEYINTPGSSLISHEIRNLDATQTDDANKLHLATTDRDIEAIRFDNSRNSAITYLKFWNAAAPDPTTDPVRMKIPIGAQQSGRITFLRGLRGVFASAMTIIATSTKGDETAQSAPSSAFHCDIITDDGT